MQTQSKNTEFHEFVFLFFFSNFMNLEISRVPDLGQGKNKWVQIWRREFSKNLALLSEEFRFRSFPDPARSELFRNLTITHYFDISRWFHAINTVIDALSWINIDVYKKSVMIRLRLHPSLSHSLAPFSLWYHIVVSRRN